MRRLIFTLTLLLISVMILIACSQPYTATVLDPPNPIDFTAQADNGEVFTLSDYDDQVVVLYFGYTHCPDICPTTLFEVSRAMDELGGRADDVQVAMLTVDPERDTAEQLNKYLGNINEEFIGLRAESEEEQAAIMQQFGVWAELEPPDGDSPNAYLVSHSTQLFVLNKDHALRLVFPYGSTAQQIAADLRKVLRN